MAEHAWEQFDSADALGPSINFQWWRCPRCGSQARTSKDSLAIFYFADGQAPPVKVTPEVLKEHGIDEDCNAQLVVHVHEL